MSIKRKVKAQVKAELKKSPGGIKKARRQAKAGGLKKLFNKLG